MSKNKRNLYVAKANKELEVFSKSFGYSSMNKDTRVRKTTNLERSAEELYLERLTPNEKYARRHKK